LNTLFVNFPFVRYTAALIAGIFTCIYFKIEIPYLLVLNIGLAFAYTFIYFLFKAQSRNILGGIGLIFLFFFGYYRTYNSFTVNDINHISKQNSYSYYKAEITSLVEEKPKSWKAIVDVDGVIFDKKYKKASGKILLYFDKTTVLKPKYGEKLLIKGVPNLVEGPKNPNEFDYRQYLEYQGIYHQQYLKDTSFVKINSAPKPNIISFAYKINSYCDSLFTHYLTSKTELAVTNAMILGLRDDIDNELIQAYSAAGAIHVLSVSGLHVGVIYIILAWLLGFLKSKGKYGKWCFLGIILFILWLYAAITGFSAPVLRSTFMFSLILIAETINRQHNSFNTVSISAFCILVYNPLLITSIGFLLSYLAVFGMIQIQPLLNPIFIVDKRKSVFHWLLDRLWKVTTVAIAAQIATLPITIYYFHQFPNYFLLANPVVIFFSSFVLIGGLVFLVLAVVFSFFKLFVVNYFLAAILNFLVKALNWTVLFTESLPGSISKYLHLSQLEMAIMYALIIGILLLIYSKKYFWVQFSAACCALLIGLSAKSFVEAQEQNLICLHAVPKASAMSVINGTNAILIANKEFQSDRKNISYRINNFWAVKSVANSQFQELPETSTIQILKGKSFLFLNEKLNSVKNGGPVAVDYLVLRNKKLRYFVDIKNKITFKYLILDGNFTTFYVQRFQQEAQSDGILAYYLLKDGALLL
jgi:competence protein ComEC